MGAAEERDAIESRRAERIVGALKARGVTLDEKRDGNTLLVRAVDRKGQHRGIQGVAKKGEGPLALRRRLLWTLAIDVEHDETGCQCNHVSCPAAAALLRRLKEAS